MPQQVINYVVPWETAGATLIKGRYWSGISGGASASPLNEEDNDRFWARNVSDLSGGGFYTITGTFQAPSTGTTQTSFIIYAGESYEFVWATDRWVQVTSDYWVEKTANFDLESGKYRVTVGGVLVRVFGNLSVDREVRVWADYDPTQGHTQITPIDGNPVILSKSQTEVLVGRRASIDPGEVAVFQKVANGDIKLTIIENENEFQVFRGGGPGIAVFLPAHRTPVAYGEFFQPRLSRLVPFGTRFDFRFIDDNGNGNTFATHPTPLPAGPDTFGAGQNLADFSTRTSIAIYYDAVSNWVIL